MLECLNQLVAKNLMILSLSVAGLVFLTPVLCHVFVIQHRRKVALSGERKLSEVYCTYK